MKIDLLGMLEQVDRKIRDSQPQLSTGAGYNIQLTTIRELTNPQYSCDTFCIYFKAHLRTL